MRFHRHARKFATGCQGGTVTTGRGGICVGWRLIPRVACGGQTGSGRWTRSLGPKDMRWWREGKFTPRSEAEAFQRVPLAVALVITLRKWSMTVCTDVEVLSSKSLGDLTCMASVHQVGRRSLRLIRSTITRCSRVRNMQVATAPRGTRPECRIQKYLYSENCLGTPNSKHIFPGLASHLIGSTLTPSLAF